MIPLALHCAAALTLAALPDDAPTAATQAPDAPADVAPSPTTPSKRLTLRPSRLLYGGGPIPDGYQLVDERNASLLFGGFSTFLFGYTGGVLFALIAGIQSLVQIQRGDPLLALLPLAGPFLALGGSGYRDQLPPDLRYVRDVVCIADGVVQWLGAILAGVGYFFPTKVLVLKEEGSTTGLILPLGPGGRPGLTWAATFGP